MRVRVLVVDDDAMVRSALAMLLGGADGVEVVGEAGDGAEVPRALAARPADVVLMDLRMPDVDGITATERLTAVPGAPRVVALTTFDSDENVLRALRAGAVGFLLKDTPPADLVAAVHRAASGEPVLSPAVTRRLVEQAVDRSDRATRARTALDRLSARERDVARSVAAGLSNAEVGARLHLSVATVKAYLSSALAKLGAVNRTEVALLVHEAGDLDG